MTNHQIAHPHAEETILKEISPIHELAARALANGSPAKEVALLCGKHANWVYQINRSPVFKARVAEIQEQLFSGSNLPQKLELLATKSADVIERRLAENSSEISVGDLTRIIGMGTKQNGTTVHVSVNNAVAIVDSKNAEFIED